MMKLLDITLKDLIQATRSLIAVMFMFVVPILVTLLFYLMFGSVGDGGGFELPRTSLVIVNLDEGQLPSGINLADDLAPGTLPDPDTDVTDNNSLGALLVTILGDETLADLLTISEMSDPAAARSAVDNQDAGLAVIIPANFTDSITDPQMTATLEMYQDPTLTIGPAIVGSIISQILDNFAAGKIGIGVAMESLAKSGIEINPVLIQNLVAEFTTGSAGQGDSSAATLVVVEAPPGSDSQTSLIEEILGLIMGGMMVFFAFFTGSASMESILAEEEKGTLARLFTTPTNHRIILSGKGLAALITLVVQVTVLMFFGNIVFGIDWGDLPTTILAGVGIILSAAATGLFLVSFLKNTRQSGIVFGGVLTLTGMLGLIPVFTAGIPNQSPTVQVASLLVPQGWAMRGLTIALDGGTVADILPTLFVILLWVLVFALIGQYRMQKRFA